MSASLSMPGHKYSAVVSESRLLKRDRGSADGAKGQLLEPLALIVGRSSGVPERGELLGAGSLSVAKRQLCGEAVPMPSSPYERKRRDIPMGLGQLK